MEMGAHNHGFHFLFALTKKKKACIWVIVDRLTKSTYFTPFGTCTKMNERDKLHVDEIVKLHGSPKSIISDRDIRFVSRFLKTLKGSMGTKINLSIAYHP